MGESLRLVLGALSRFSGLGAMFVLAFMVFPQTVRPTGPQQLVVAEVLNHQRIKFNNGLIWNFRMVWVPEFASVASELIGQTLQIEALFDNRYGETIGNLYDMEANWIQEAWLAEGKAVTWPISIDANQSSLNENFEFMLEAEGFARDDELGIWNLDHPASDFYTTTDDLEVDPYFLRGQFIIAEGEVTEAVARQQDDQTVIFVNFGEDYKQDFTVVIAPPVYSEFRSMLKQESFTLKELSGKSIRARGILGLYNGPSLALTHPYSVEILED